jgi:hypothetical protein
VQRAVRTVLAAVVVAAAPSACSDGGAVTGEPTMAGPLNEYTAEYLARTTAAAERARIAGADAVAACMHAQGFDHVPFGDTWSSGVVWAPGGDSAWTREHGYGMVEGLGTSTSEQTAEDPNQEMVAAMSPAEREAYQLALDGPVGEPERGCAALQPDGDDAWSDETFLHFFQEASRLNAEARESPAVAALEEEWRVCMDDAGVPGYETPADARADVQGKVDAARPGGAGPIPEPRRSELRELELRVATADVGCDEQVGLERAVDDAMRTAQTAYVEEHRAELDGWVLTWPEPADDADDADD